MGSSKRWMSATKPIIRSSNNFSITHIPKTSPPKNKYCRTLQANTAIHKISNLFQVHSRFPRNHRPQTKKSSINLNYNWKHQIVRSHNSKLNVPSGIISTRWRNFIARSCSTFIMQLSYRYFSGTTSKPGYNFE